MKGYGDGVHPQWWRDASVALVFKKRGQKDSLVNYGVHSLTSVPGKTMEQILLEDVSRPMKGE